MYINRFFTIFLALVLAACGIAPKSDINRGMYGQMDADAPIILPDAAHMSSTARERKIAVLLPLTGTNGATGTAIASAITAATLQNAPDALTVTFHDTAKNINDAINAAGTPDIFIGPVFADNARAVRDATNIPALSFTSDVTATGDGVYSVSLLPTASVHTIIPQMATDGVKNFIIMAPDNTSGKLMAGAAEQNANERDMTVSGVFFYNPGDTDSIKNTVANASMNAARVAANNRAREVLSDILTTERLTAIERSNISRQLEKISKAETMGELPYRAILLLGDGADAKTIASFLRYYGVTSREATIYGTALWDGSDDAMYDLTLSGARFAALPKIEPGFATNYETMTGAAPSRLATFGYDAANMAIGMLYSGGGNDDYLTQERGFIGANGLVRLDDNGANNRALQIMELNGTDTPTVIATSAQSFSESDATDNIHKIPYASARNLESDGINPMNFINIPERFRSQYKSKTYGANMKHSDTKPAATVEETILPEDDAEPIVSPEYQSAKTETVSRTFIDSVEIEE